jgi:hypothetical protein
MMAVMTASAGTVAWIGAGGVIIGAAVGAFSGWITAAVTSRRAAGEARGERRREAYAAFLGALDEILSLYLKAEDFGQQLRNDPDFAPLARQALSSIAHTSVAVLLAGSDAAREKVKGIEDARWALYRLLKTPDDLEGLGLRLQQIADLQKVFGDLATDELRGPQPWRAILTKRRSPAAENPEAAPG